MIGFWWALWLGTALLDNVVRAVDQQGDASNVPLLIAQAAAEAGMAVVAIALLWGIASAQRRLTGPELAEVFA